MGKKKKKSRGRTRQKPRLERSRSTAELRRELEESLSLSRGRKALGLAKLLLKQPDFSPDDLPRVVRAYEIRLSEMLDAGQAREAASFYQTVISSHPRWEDLVSRSLLARMDFETGSASVLPGYGKVGEIADGVGEYIKTSLKDLSLVRDHSGLPAGHPLKREAASVIDAWREVEGEADTGAFSRMRRTVGRRSPFIDWRMLVTAIKAYYERDDRLCLDCLGRISPGSPPGKIAAALAGVIGDTAADNPAAGQLRSLLAGPSLHSELLEVDRLLEAGNYRPARSNFRKLYFSPLLAGKDGLRRELSAFFGYKLALHDQDIPAFFANTPDQHRIVGLLACRTGFDDYSVWGQVMAMEKFSPPARALIYNRMAERIIGEIPEIGRMLAVRRMGNKVPEMTRDFLRDAADCWQDSVEIHPLPETYRQWYEHTSDTASAGEKEALLKRWARDFPEDREPLLKMVICCRERKAHTKALKLFAGLETRTGKDPEIDRLRRLLHIDKAVDLLKKDRLDEASSRLRDVGSPGDPFTAALVGVISWLLDLRRGGEDSIRAAAAAMLELKQPLSVRHILERLDSYYRLPALPEPPPDLRRQAGDPEIAMENAGLLIGQDDPVWKINRVPLADREEAAAYLRTAADPSRLVDLLEFIFSEDPELKYPESSLLAWPLTANGLRRKGRELPVFLTYRALLLAGCWEWIPRSRLGEAEHRIELCLSAAHRLAVREGKASTIAFVKQACEDNGFPPEAFEGDDDARTTRGRETIAKIVRREAEDASYPPPLVVRPRVRRPPLGSGSGRGPSQLRMEFDKSPDGAGGRQ